MKINYFIFFIYLILMIFYADNLYADDPLHGMSGMENWDEIDTTSVDEDYLWNELIRDLERYDFFQALFAKEKSEMTRWALHFGINSDNEETAPQENAEARQARIDEIRRTRDIAPVIRDENGQIIDDERPWDIR